MRYFGRLAAVEREHDGALRVTATLIPLGSATVDRGALDKAVATYSKFPSVREMGAPLNAAGTAGEIKVQADGSVAITARIIDPGAVKKTTAGVYKALALDTTGSGESLRVRALGLVDAPSEEISRLAKLAGGTSSPPDPLEAEAMAKALARHRYSIDDCRKAARSGAALETGDWPILDGADLARAVTMLPLVQRDRPRVLAHVERRAKALGLRGQLPVWMGGAQNDTELVTAAFKAAIARGQAAFRGGR